MKTTAILVSVIATSFAITLAYLAGFDPLGLAAITIFFGASHACAAVANRQRTVIFMDPHTGETLATFDPDVSASPFTLEQGTSNIGDAL